MTLVLTPAPPHRPEPDLARRFQQELTEWGDPAAAAAAAVAVLGQVVPGALAAVFRQEHETQSALVLAASPHATRGPTVGARVLLGDGLIAAALREDRPQRVVDSYVDPDFTGAEPGEPRSILAVPFGAGAHAGVLRLEYPRQGRPSEADEQAATLLAALLGIAVRATPPVRGASAIAVAADRVARERSVLAATAAHLAQSNDLGRSMQRLAESAQELLEGESAFLLVRHGSRSVLEVTAVAGPVPLAPGDVVPLDGHALAPVLTTAQPRIWSQRADAAPLLGAAHALPDVREALTVPLIAGGRAFGALTVLNPPASTPFSPSDIETLQHLANQSAGLESLRLLQPLRQRLSDSSIIAEVGRAVTGTLGLDEVLALVVRAAEMLAGGQGAAVALLDERGRHITLEAASGALQRHQGETLPLQDSLLGWTARTGEAVISPSLMDDPRTTELEKRPGPGVVVPIEAHAQVYGVLFAVRAAQAASPSDEDVDALRKLAAYAAIAIENARLYREQIQLSARLRAQAAELEKAYADLSESQERLLVAEKMAALGRVTAGIAHEINSPLGGILNCLQMAQSYVEEYRSSIGDPEVSADDHRAIANDLREALSLAEHSGKKVAQFVRSIKNQTRMDDTQRGHFDAALEIEGSIALLQHELRNRHVELHLDVAPGCKLLGDPGKFALVLQNLLTNAIDAHEQKAGEVWIRLRQQDGAVVLEVEDRGCGIPEEIRGKIYDYLFTTKDVGQGTGLGLATVHSIVTSHFEGSIHFRSEVGSGTTFSVTFPSLTERG